MLQNHLTKTKGRLLEMMFHQYLDMNTNEDKIDYDSFYQEFLPTIAAIQGINTIDRLEDFCEEFGLNDMDNEMSFPNLVKQAYE